MNRKLARTTVLFVIVLGMIGIGTMGPTGCCRACRDTGSGATAPEANALLYTAPDAAPDAAVGVFDRTEVLVAYYKSKYHADRFAALMRDRDAALREGDKARASQAERKGEAMQELAHRQLAGTAPLPNVAEDLADALPRIARDAGAARIMARGSEPHGVQAVDVTAALVESLPPVKR